MAPIPARLGRFRLSGTAARRTSQGNIKLMPKKQVLDLKLPLRPQRQIDQNEPVRRRIASIAVNDARSVPARESAADRIFGNDR
jgi:hypothetical protein